MDLASLTHLAVGVVANLLSFVVCVVQLKPVMMFYVRRGWEGMRPEIGFWHIMAAVSALVSLTYGLLEGHVLLISNSTIMLVFQTAYAAVFICCSSPRFRALYLKFVLLEAALLGSFIVFALIYTDGHLRLSVSVVGWLSVLSSCYVFVRRIITMVTVATTRSTKYLSFPLSLCITLAASLWLLYGVLTRNVFIWLPSSLGILTGCADTTRNIPFCDA